MAMMLIAASVSAQTDMNAVFNIGENAKKLELQKIEEDRKRDFEISKFYENCGYVKEFANSLRNEGVDVTAFTDADIDRLDLIRKSKRGEIELPFDDRFYDMPSDHFKIAMLMEKENYWEIASSSRNDRLLTLRVKRKSDHILIGENWFVCNDKLMTLNDGDTLKLDSVTIVRIKRNQSDSYLLSSTDKLIAWKKDFLCLRMLYDGDTLKVGNVSIICSLEQKRPVYVMPMKNKKSKRKHK